MYEYRKVKEALKNKIAIKFELLLNSVLYNACLLENYLTNDGNQKTCLFLLKTF